MARVSNDRPLRRRHLSTPAVFLLVAALALLYGALHLALPDTDQLPVAGDSAKYDALARTVAQLLGSPSTVGALVRGTLPAEERAALELERWELQHAPGYILPLGLLYALFPDDQGAGRSFSILLFAAAIALWAVVARRLARGCAWWLLPLCLLYPPLLYYGSGIATEPHALFSVALTAWAWMRYHRRATPRRALLLGLVLAHLFLAKTTFRSLSVLILIAELLYLCWRRWGGRWRRRRSGGRGALVERPWLGAAAALAGGMVMPLLAGMVALLAADLPLNPVARSGEDMLWVYRGNYVPDQGWENVGLGDAITPELAAGGEQVIAETDPDELGFEDRRGAYVEALKLTIARYPLGWVGLVAKKFGLFWSYPAVKSYLATPLGAWPVPRAVHLALVPLALLGLAVTIGRRDGSWLPGALALGVAAVHAGSHLVARYHLPVLPALFVYALLGARRLVITVRQIVGRRPAHGQRVVPGRPAAGGLRRLLLSALATGVGLLLAGALLMPPVSVALDQARVLYALGAVLLLLAPLAALPGLLVLWGGLPGRRPRRRLGLMLALLLLAIPLAGSAVSEPDWDEFAVTLRRPGEVLLHRIGLPPRFSQAPPGSFAGVELELDLLRSIRGHFRFEVWVQGARVKSFVDTLGGEYAAFLFDPHIHRAQDRYRRVADTYARFVTERLNPMYGAASPGYDYFRRWVRIPLPVSALQADKIDIELRLVEASGGAWVRLYGDRYRTREDAIEGPAIGESPFEHSNYRAEFFAGNRAETDARLIRARQRWSPWRASLRRTRSGLSADLNRGWRVVEGDLRVYARVFLPGRPVRRQVGNETRVVWTNQPQAGDEELSAGELRRMQWWRDEYFDGTRIL